MESHGEYANEYFSSALMDEQAQAMAAQANWGILQAELDPTYTHTPMMYDAGLAPEDAIYVANHASMMYDEGLTPEHAFYAANHTSTMYDEGLAPEEVAYAATHTSTMYDEGVTSEDTIYVATQTENHIQRL